MNDSQDSLSEFREAVARKGSFWQTVKAVSWSFLGIRQSSAYAHDVQKLNPLHVIVVGILAAILFVLAIVALVQWVVHSGVAA